MTFDVPVRRSTTPVAGTTGRMLLLDAGAAAVSTPSRPITRTAARAAAVRTSSSPGREIVRSRQLLDGWVGEADLMAAAA